MNMKVRKKQNKILRAKLRLGGHVEGTDWKGTPVEVQINWYNLNFGCVSSYIVTSLSKLIEMRQ